MARVQRIKKKKDPETGKRLAGGTPTFEYVDTKTGEVFASPESILSKKEVAGFSDDERRKKLVGARREKLGLSKIDELPEDRDRRIREGRLPPKEEKAQAFLEERGFFEEESPQRVELDIEKEKGIFGAAEKIPVIGRTPLIAGENLIKAGITLFGHRPSLGEEALLQDPETFRELAKRKIQEDTIAEGLSAGERFGAVIESIPIASSLVNKFGSALIEDPKRNVDTIIKEIGSERERASVLAEKLATGKINPFVGFDELESMEDNITHLEQRIKILASTSAILKADPDEVNRIEEAILRAKERIFMAKLAAGQGATIEATEASWFYTLQELEEQRLPESSFSAEERALLET